MARVMNWIYGIALILVALDAMFFGFLPADMSPIIVIILGALILLTPISSNPYTPAKLGWLRQYVFGAALVIMGVASSGWLTGLVWLEGATIETWAGQAILIVIGLIYLFAVTKAGAYKIGTV